MRSETLRDILLATLASTSLCGLSACSDCSEDGRSDPVEISPRTFPIPDVTPDYTTVQFWSSADVAAYLTYVDHVTAEPCQEFCSQTPTFAGATFDSCSSVMSTYYDDAGSISPYVPNPPQGLPAVTVTCEGTAKDCRDPVSFGGGRRFAGFVQVGTPHRADARGEFFASMAELEAASVSAFQIVARDLERLGAPRRLVRSALRARSDEERHTRAASKLARRFGARPDVAIEVPRWRARSLESVAIENAVEGCTRETYGALIAHWTADNARDAGVRSAMSAIARDETRHAALAWQIAAWASRGLRPIQRLQVAMARALAVAELARELATPVAEAVVRDRIVPAAPLRLALLGSVERGLGKARARIFGRAAVRPPPSNEPVGGERFVYK